jgi:sec-independent protein translocase protein TatA
MAHAGLRGFPATARSHLLMVQLELFVQKGASKKGVTMFEGLAQPMHLILILLIVLIIFGPGKLPELGEGLGKSIKAFRKAMKEGQDAPAIEKKAETKS